MKLHGDGIQTQAVDLGQQNPNQTPSPEGAEQSFLIPNQPLIEGNAVRVQRLPEFRES